MECYGLYKEVSPTDGSFVALGSLLPDTAAAALAVVAATGVEST